MKKSTEFKVLNKIDPLSLANISGLVAVVFGLVSGLYLAVTDLGSFLFGSNLAYLGVIVLPVLYGVLVYLIAYIFAIVYNAFARKIGGIKIEIISRR